VTKALALLVLTTAIAAGCGTSKVVDRAQGPPPRVQRMCETRGADANGRMHELESGFRLCRNLRGSRAGSTIEHDDGHVWHVVAGPLPGLDGQAGEWFNVDRSPDGHTILAQWEGPCEVPNAFFLDADGSGLRPVTGQRDWHRAPMSIGIGWAKDGRARVRVLGGGCGPDYSRPGIYLIEPATSRGEFVRKLAVREGA